MPYQANAERGPAADGEHLASLYQTVFRRALYLIGDRHSAEDAAQETFFRYLNRRPSGLDNPAAWLYTVVTRVCYDWMKRAKRSPMTTLSEAGEFPDLQPTPEEALTDLEDLFTVRRALEELGPRDRIILLMRHSASSYREIARAVGCAEGSVGQLLHRAERRFKAAYEELSNSSS